MDRDLRTDIHGSIAAVQNLTDNAANTDQMLGRAPSPGELALAHQQRRSHGGANADRRSQDTSRNLAVNNVNPCFAAGRGG